MLYFVFDPAFSGVPIIKRCLDLEFVFLNISNVTYAS